MKNNNLIKIGALVMLTISVASCQKEQNSNIVNDSKIMGSPFKSNINDVSGITFYALSGNMLDMYSTTNPDKMLNSVMISGLQSGEMLLGLDFRPATGQLYGLGSNSRLYTINPTNGMATFVASLTTIPAGSITPVALMLSGTSFGFDFNPTVDRIRIVSNTGQNLRANPVSGLTIVDGNINPQPANINGVAYTNNDTDPSTGTELYGFDVTKDLIYTVNPPNAGTLVSPKDMKLKIDGDGGFDIAPRNMNITTDIGLGLYEVNKKSTLFRVDLETGVTKILTHYKKGLNYTSIAISPII